MKFLFTFSFVQNLCINQNIVKMTHTDHPLKKSEDSYLSNELEQQIQVFRRHEGLGGPMRLMMEMQAYKRVGRLPFLPSSRVHMDVILGRDETIDFTDFLGTEEFSEKMSSPQAIAEKKVNFN